MMAVAKRQPVSVEPAAYLLRAHSRYREGDNPAPMLSRRRSDNANTHHFRQRFKQLPGEVAFVAGDGVPIELFHPAHRGAEADRRFNRWGACLKPARRVGKLGII